MHYICILGYHLFINEILFSIFDEDPLPRNVVLLSLKLLYTKFQLIQIILTCDDLNLKFLKTKSFIPSDATRVDIPLYLLNNGS